MGPKRKRKRRLRKKKRPIVFREKRHPLCIIHSSHWHNKRSYSKIFHSPKYKYNNNIISFHRSTCYDTNIAGFHENEAHISIIRDTAIVKNEQRMERIFFVTRLYDSTVSYSTQ